MPINPYTNTDIVKAVIKVRRGPEVDRAQVTYEDGELIYSTDKKRLFVGDGVGDEGTDGGNLVGNRLWISDSFNSAGLPYIEKYDLVYRPSTTGFYILTGDSIVDPKSYLLVGGNELIPKVSTYTIPKATNSTLGGVIVKSGLTVDLNGNINIDYDPNTLTLIGNKLSVIAGVGTGTGTIGNASYSSYGKLRVIQNSGLIIDSGNLSVSIDNSTIKLSSIGGIDRLYVDPSQLDIQVTLPKATISTLGGIIVGDGLKINSSTGELSLKTATDSIIGGIKTGYALSADPNTSILDILTDNKTIQVNGGTNKLEVKYPIANNGDILTYNRNTQNWEAGYNPQFTNRIINGNMSVDQRNNGASQTFTASTSLSYCVDRFYVYCTGANITGQRVLSGTAGTSKYRYKFTGAASNTGLRFGTRLESNNVFDLVNDNASLQIKAYSTSITSLSWAAYYANTDDTFGTIASPTRTQIAVGFFTIDSTENTYSTQISIPAAATTGIEIVFSCGPLLATQTLILGDIQFEKSSIATPFKFRPYGMELNLCQRYFYKTTGEWPMAIRGFNGAEANNYVGVNVVFPNTMRTAPVMSGDTYNYGTNNGSGMYIDRAYIAAISNNTSNTCALTNALFNAEL